MVRASWPITDICVVISKSHMARKRSGHYGGTRVTSKSRGRQGAGGRMASKMPVVLLLLLLYTRYIYQEIGLPYVRHACVCVYIDGPHTHTHGYRQLHSVKRRNKRNVIIKYKTNKGKSSLHFTCLPRIVGHKHTAKERERG